MKVKLDNNKIIVSADNNNTLDVDTEFMLTQVSVSWNIVVVKILLVTCLQNKHVHNDSLRYHTHSNSSPRLGL